LRDNAEGERLPRREVAEKTSLGTLELKKSTHITVYLMTIYLPDFII